MAPKRREIPYQEVNGFKVPKHFNADTYSSALSYRPRDDDVFVVSYPKSGTTWIQYLVYLIYNNGEHADDVASLLSSIPYPERDGFKIRGDPDEMCQRPIALKYHVPYPLIPKSPAAKYIYVARNPKDTCVSFYHFCRTLPGYEFQNGSFEDFFELFVSGDLPFGDYFDHVLSWWDHREDPNVLFLTYEALKCDIKFNIAKIMSFLGVDLTRQNLLDDILLFSSIDYMKEHVNNLMERYLLTSPRLFHLQLLRTDSSCSEEGKKASHLREMRPKMIRKGIVGDWRNYFTNEQKQRIDERFRLRTSGTDLHLLWT